MRSPSSVCTVPRTKDMPAPTWVLSCEYSSQPCHRTGSWKLTVTVIGAVDTVRWDCAVPMPLRAHRRRDPEMAGEIGDQRLGQIVALRDRVVVQPRVEFWRPDLVGTVDVNHVDEPQFPPDHRHREEFESAGAATSGRGRWCGSRRLWARRPAPSP